MIRINDELLNQTTDRARSIPRLRMNYNFHPNHEDTINRLLNAMEPWTYIQPHKHENPDRFEVFLALRGRFVVFNFDENGNIADHAILDAREGKYGVEIPPKTFHTLFSLETNSVAYEIKEGPFIPGVTKNVAPWAPAEGDLQVIPYMKNLLKLVDIQLF